MRRSLILLISLFTFQFAIGQTSMKDLLDAINWNQNEKEFLGQWSEQLVKVNHFYNEYGKWYRDYEFHDVYLSDMKLTFGVGINEEDHSIRSIHGSFVSYNSDLDTFNKADRLLRRIYGTPDNIKDKLNEKYTKSKTVLWYNNGYELELKISLYSTSNFIHLTATKHGNGQPTVQFSSVNKFNSQIDNNSNKPDIRVARWGDSKETIRKKEGKANMSTDPDVYMFKDDIAGLPCIVGYIFLNNKLSMAKYLLKQEHSNKNDFIEDYNMLVGLLTKKYGNPIMDEEIWKNDLYKDDFSKYGFAISAGHLEYIVKWNLNRTEISVILNGDNLETSMVVQYVSKQSKDAQKLKQEKGALDKL